jgi:hypothetical protein
MAMMSYLALLVMAFRFGLTPSLKERKATNLHYQDGKDFADWLFLVTFEKDYGVASNEQHRLSRSGGLCWR